MDWIGGVLEVELWWGSPSQGCCQNAWLVARARKAEEKVSGDEITTFCPHEQLQLRDTTMAAQTMGKSVAGKRKREDDVKARKVRVVDSEDKAREEQQEEGEEDGESSDGEGELDPAEIFRRHFEAKFKPLPEVKKKKKVVTVEEEEDDEDDDDEWGGLSGDEEDDDDEDDEDDEDEEGSNGAQKRKIDVVEHSSNVSAPKMSKAELKAFMVRSSYIPP